MKRDENTPVRLRTIMEDVYEAAGFTDHRFSIPQPLRLTTSPPLLKLAPARLDWLTKPTS